MMETKGVTKSNIFLIFCAVLIIFLRFISVDSEPDDILREHVGERVSFKAEIEREPDERDTATRYIVSNKNSDSKILLVASRFPAFKYGDKVEVVGRLGLPENFEGDSGIEFDYVSYLSKDRIHFIIYQPEIVLLEHGGNPFFKSLYALKNYFVWNVSKVVPEPNSSLINGFIFGARQSLGANLLDRMKNVGLIHIVAISGYNVTIVATSIMIATSYFGRRRLGLILGAIGILLFALMVGFGSTVLRASLMAVIAILARYLGRQSEALRALFVAVFLMLLWNPLLLTRDPSFQLSSMATLGLILFSPIVYSFISKKFPRIPEKFGFREIVSSTFAVQIFLLPLLIHMTGIFSPISFIVNLIVLPLIPAAMLLGFMTGVLGILGILFSWTPGALSYLLTEFIIQVVQISSQIPFAFLNIGSLSLWAVFVWYLFYAWAFLKFSSMTDQFKLAKKSSI